MDVSRRTLLISFGGAAAAVGLSACNSDSGSSGASGDKSLVVDNQFDLKSLDPARQFELTGSLLDAQIYESALSFDGASVKKVVPGICKYEISSDQKTLTLTIDGTHKFSDGTDVSADDIVFSYQRVQGIKGNPSFMLDGVTVTKKDDKTVVLTSADPNPQLVYILPNSSLGIVNSKVVKANGGTTDANDKAEDYLNKNSQGSGPYMVDTYDVQSKVILKTNPNYAGTKPTFGRVVVQNVEAATQEVNLKAGSSQIATSLNPDQIAQLDTSKFQVVAGDSTTTIFMWFNMTAQYGKAASDKNFIQAMRHAIDYSALLQIAGQGAKQPGGLVPLSFLGALDSDPNNVHDAAKAKDYLSKSTYKGETITVLFSNDVGYSLSAIAQAVQSQAKAVGINLTLNPQPSATSLDAFRSGKTQAGIAYWGADYPDPADYLVFAPGQSLGKRAAWTPALSPTCAALADAAVKASGDAARDAAYKKLQQQFNIEGPWIPLFLPAKNLAAANSLKNVLYNPIWGVILSAVQ